MSFVLKNKISVAADTYRYPPAIISTQILNPSGRAGDIRRWYCWSC